MRAKSPKEIAGNAVVRINDYKTSISIDAATKEQETLTLPKSNVLCFFLACGSSVIVRPSGTEPKIKIYINAVGETSADADTKRSELLEAGTQILGF